MNDTMSEIGMQMAMMSVALHCPRKNNTTITTNINAYITDSVRELMEFWMVSDESLIISNLMSGGRVFWMSTIIFLTSLQICTVLPPVCFMMMRRQPSRELIFESRKRSLMVSRTTAMSFTNTFLPCGVVVTTRLLISELSLNSLFTRRPYCSRPIFTVPDDTSRLLEATAFATCSRLMPNASILVWSTST